MDFLLKDDLGFKASEEELVGIDNRCHGTERGSCCSKQRDVLISFQRHLIS